MRRCPRTRAASRATAEWSAVLKNRRDQINILKGLVGRRDGIGGETPVLVQR
jgi:hypothetical protein